MKHTIKYLILMLLVVCVAVSLTGCRESLKIAKIIHDQQMEEQDKEDETKLAQNDPDNQEKDEELPALKKSDANRNSDQIKQADTRGNVTNPGTASRTVHDSKSAKNTKADKSGKKKSENTDDTSKNKKGTGGKGSSGGGGETGGKGGDRQIYDDNGNVVDLPENVDSVVASGSAAVIVQMLGGKNILSGSSASITGNSMMQRVFDDEGFEEIQTYWDDDGRSPMSSASFNVLLKNKPDVCIASSGSFSDAQLKKLKDKGIAYVSLPAMDTAEHIQKAVSITGKMLGDRTKSGGQNAKQIASNYADYCEGLISDVSGAAGDRASQCYSLYISGWDDAASLSIPSVNYYETGLAYTSVGNKPMAEFMKIGGVTDNTASYNMSGSVDYAIVPLNINTATDANVDNGLSLLERKGGSSANRSLIRNNTYNLGNDEFKWVITDSQYTRDCILGSAASDGIWTPFPKATAATGERDYGFLSNGSIVRTNIRGNYNVVTNPYGICSWADGSPESILECIWAAWKIAGVYSESDVKQEIKYFYKTFYRCNLTSSQVNEILAGI